MQQNNARIEFEEEFTPFLILYAKFQTMEDILNILEKKIVDIKLQELKIAKDNLLATIDQLKINILPWKEEILDVEPGLVDFPSKEILRIAQEEDFTTVNNFDSRSSTQLSTFYSSFTKLFETTAALELAFQESLPGFYADAENKNYLFSLVTLAKQLKDAVKKIDRE